MLNRKGRRFVDEGEDLNLYTYAKFGRAILAEPGAKGYQLFDSKVLHLLEPRYATSKPIVAGSPQELLARLDIDDIRQAVKTAEDSNAAPRTSATFAPTRKAAHPTRGLHPDKSIWPPRLDTPPYVAYSVTGGITFTFGGLKINENAQVIGTD